MAPFSTALSITRVSHPESDGAVVRNTYTGIVDSDWTIFVVPNGGFILGLLINACIQFQSTTQHRDPIHVSVHFLRQATASVEFSVEIQTVKFGKGYSNVTAEFIQQDQTKFVAHLIFGTLAVPGMRQGLTILPNSPFARRIPLHQHPSTSRMLSPNEYPSQYANFKQHIQSSMDPVILSQNQMDSATRSSRHSIGGQAVQFGGWFQLAGEDEQITLSAIALVVDVFPAIPALLPHEVKKGMGKSWFPTMTMSIEYKTPIPTSEHYSMRTVGLYVSTRFINDNRYDVSVEVWTAPCDIGQGSVEEDWREKQICLAVSSQMCLIVPISVNTRNSSKL